MSRYILLLNLASGGNQRGMEASEVCQTVESVFREAGHAIESRMIQPRELERALEDAIAEEPFAILIAGGDGTVSAAARQLGGTPIALGILPMGTFNLAARDLGIPLEIEDAARFLATAQSIAIDVLDVGGEACLCTTILGFYPEFGKIFEARDHQGRWWRKSLKVISGLPQIFARARPLTLVWHSDHGNGVARTKFAAFSPGRYRRRPGLVPSRTDFRSGMMTAYIGHQVSPAAAFRGIVDYALGRQEENPDLKIFKSDAIGLRAHRRKSCVVMLDGEILRMNFPIQLKILHLHLHVLTTEEMLAEEPGEEA
jgi:diacylglycerol kinase family enzyme